MPLVCLVVPLQMSEVTGSEAGTGPSLAQGSTGPPEEEEVLGGTGGPQGSALGGVTATGEGEMQGRVNTTHHTYNAQKWRELKAGLGFNSVFLYSTLAVKVN